MRRWTVMDWLAFLIGFYVLTYVFLVAVGVSSPPAFYSPHVAR